MHVLIIDDNLAARTSLALLLSAAGHTCVTAACGLEGLAKLSAGIVDAVILDLLMPGMNGQQFLTEMAHTSRQVPVIILTGLEMPAVIDGVPNVVASLEKPADPDIVLSLLDKIAEKGSKVKM